ncbi:MAG: peroxiredoxin [Moraxellaceae bacterium]|nr:peroxiredoxin [Moraxellaceae bacterium]
MAKPTTENLSLPNFVSRLVKADNLQTLEISLEDLQKQENKGLIVYFYPRDNTTGCTTQAQDFTTMRADFEKLGYSMVGVSRDSVTSHEKFIENKELAIDLISDEDEKLCQHFDVIKEKNMYGKKVLGLVRSTFVFDNNGKLTHAQRNLRAKGYAERLLAVLSEK